jgi:hypothetical protein
MEGLGEGSEKSSFFSASLCPAPKEDKIADFWLKAESIAVLFKILNSISVEVAFLRHTLDSVR